MSATFVPPDFEPPTGFDGPGFRLEPLGPTHNERDHEAWMSSIDHIRATPGMGGEDWPAPMTLEENLGDMKMHAGEFDRREAFTYSILDGDAVIGCLYIYPADGEHDAQVRSWVTESRSEMDHVVWRSISDWLANDWPFNSVLYVSRD